MAPPPEGLYPALGMHSLGEEVQLDLHAAWRREEDDGLMMVDDGHEDDWGRLHDVTATGTVRGVTTGGGCKTSRQPAGTTLRQPAGGDNWGGVLSR